MDLIELITTELKKRKITNRELAERTGYTEVSISRWLNHRREPKFKDMVKMLEVLDLKLLVYYEGKDVSYEYGCNPYQE